MQLRAGALCIGCICKCDKAETLGASFVENDLHIENVPVLSKHLSQIRVPEPEGYVGDMEPFGRAVLPSAILRCWSETLLAAGHHRPLSHLLQLQGCCRINKAAPTLPALHLAGNHHHSTLAHIPDERRAALRNHAAQAWHCRGHRLLLLV